LYIVYSNAQVVIKGFTETNGQGFTKQLYEQIRKEFDLEHNHHAGEIFHAVGFDNSGEIDVTDIRN
jgi:hypothetical protein